MATATTREITDVAEVEPDELDLLKRIAGGDGAAFGLLADRLSPVLKRVLHRLGLVDADVDDLTQETLVRIWHSSASFKGQSSVSTWACRIALNLGISHLRRARRAPAEELPAESDAAQEWEAGHRAGVVRAAVLALPLNLRTVIVLREYEDRPYREIADILEIPIGTVMSRLHEARGRLRHRLADAV